MTMLQTQLDDFAKRLRALENEFEQLQLIAAAEAQPEQFPPKAIDSPQPFPRPPYLLWAQDQLQHGKVKAALKSLEIARARAFDERDLDLLAETLGLARLAASMGGGMEPQAERLIYVIEQNIRFIEHEPVAASAAVHPLPTVRPPLPAPDRPPARQPAFRVPQLELSDLLGARALAIAGGVVTLLGIVFFFVLAVNRGWIGPAGRVGLGVAASLAVFGGGVELRRRYGPTHSALAAVGVGIAGGFATLLAATALYDLIPDAAALAIVAAIAAVGLVTALVWNSQLIAGFGLIGATCVPAAEAAQGGLSVVGTSFVAIVFAAVAIVALRQRWRDLLIVGAVASGLQIVALVLRPEYNGAGPWRIVVLAAVFSLLYTAAGIAYELRLRTALGQVTTSLVLGGGTVATVAALRLFATTDHQGYALLAVALAHGLLAAGLFPRRVLKDLSALLASAGFTLGAFAFGDLFSGQPLAYAWAGESVALAWLAARTRELRLQAWSAIYLLLALGHVLAVDARPSNLFNAVAHPATGAPTAVAVAAAAGVFARYARPSAHGFVQPRGIYRLAAGFFEGLETRQHLLRVSALWLAGVSATYAASLGTLALFASFDWSHVAVVGLWSMLALGLVLVGLRLDSFQLRIGGLVWFGTTALIVVPYASIALAPTPRAYAFIVLAATLLAAGIADELQRRRTVPLELVPVVATLGSLALACSAIVLLLGDTKGAVDPLGSALLGLAALYGGIASALFRRPGERELRTLLWAIAITLAAVSFARLLSGTYIVVAWCLAGVALSWLASRVRESRFLVGAATYFALALGHALTVEAPPTHLFSVRLGPVHGAVAVFVAAAAVAAATRLAMLAPRVRAVAWWIVGVSSVYALSLCILDLLERAFPNANLHSQFQRGQTGVTAFWGLLGLGLLYAGLTRWRSLRVAGLALFAVSLAKIFFYDLASLSSITRALSFLAVGAVTLLGGFFYQRLAHDHG